MSSPIQRCRKGQGSDGVRGATTAAKPEIKIC